MRPGKRFEPPPECSSGNSLRGPSLPYDAHQTQNSLHLLPAKTFQDCILCCVKLPCNCGQARRWFAGAVDWSTAELTDMASPRCWSSVHGPALMVSTKSNASSGQIWVEPNLLWGFWAHPTKANGMLLFWVSSSFGRLFQHAGITHLSRWFFFGRILLKRLASCFFWVSSPCLLFLEAFPARGHHSP